MCGQVTKKMSVQNIVEELTQVCIQVQRNLNSESSLKEKQKLVLKHIKQYANSDIRINDFQKGLEWFNVSEALSVKKHLTEKIVLLDFFTYCCINCMHILPDLDAIEKKFSIRDGLVVVGVHSAKFNNERDSKKVLSAVQRYNIAHPVVNDAKLSMWRDIGIVCWPSLVMMGPKGQILAVFVGEGHREELFLYVEAALSYFKSQDQISDHLLPLSPAQHLLPLSKSTLLFPGKIHLSHYGQEKIIISDTGNNRILILSENGAVEHVIGGCSPGFKDGDFKKARFNAPQGIASFNHFIYVADNENHAIRKIDLEKKIVTTVAGTGSQGHDKEGGKSGINQPLSSPWDVVVYNHEFNGKIVPVLIIAIAGTHQIWALFLEDTIWWKAKSYKAGTCLAIVGTGREENRNNSYPHAASLAQPSGLALAQELKAVFFADSESSTIRRVHLENGRVSAVCGADRNPANLHNFGDVDGKLYEAKLQHPLGVAWHQIEKEVYIADTYNHKIKKVDPNGNCQTLYGDGKPTTLFNFDEPSGLAINNSGDVLYVADTNNHTIKTINMKTSEISTLKIDLREDAHDTVDNSCDFNTAISTKGGKLNITFDVAFKNELKLNSDAPQKWTLTLPSDKWKADTSSGKLSEPISINIPEGDGCKKLYITLDLVACKTTECIPKKLLIVYNIEQKLDSPTNVNEQEQINI